MTRSNSTFKESFNRTLDLIGSSGTLFEVPTEADLAETLNVSRTTVRGILAHLQTSGVIEWSGRSKQVLRSPIQSDYFPVEETEPAGKQLPSQFMEHIFAGELSPGTTLRETELAKTFDVSSTTMREFLIRFSRFGLIEKTPNRHWVLNGFTREFAEELFAVREMFETAAFQHFLDCGPDAHQCVIDLRAEHEAIAANIREDYVSFPRLDEAFHRIWFEGFGNRFVHDFFDIVSLIFHYHYRWNKIDELERNHVAIVEHLSVISALEARDREAAETAFRRHLISAKETLINSAIWD